MAYDLNGVHMCVGSGMMPKAPTQIVQSEDNTIIPGYGKGSFREDQNYRINQSSHVTRNGPVNFGLAGVIRHQDTES